MKKKHLPLMGVGPLYVVIIILFTVSGILASELKIIGKITYSYFYIPIFVIGIVFIALGVVIWYSANFQSKLDENIKNNKLITTGIYAYVRNPIYSAFLMICTGALLLSNNVWLLILPIIYWAFLTILMKFTEEKWLKNLYGSEYIEYCKKVNRCIPFF